MMTMMFSLARASRNASRNRRACIGNAEVIRGHHRDSLSEDKCYQNGFGFNRIDANRSLSVSSSVGEALGHYRMSINATSSLSASASMAKALCYFRMSSTANSSLSASSSMAKALCYFRMSSTANSSLSASPSMAKALGHYQMSSNAYGSLSASSSIDRYKRDDEHAFFVELLEKYIKRVESRVIYIINPKPIHAMLMKRGLTSDQVWGKMIRLYGSLGYIDYTQRLFNQLYQSNVAGLAVWNATIATLGLNGKSLQAICMFFNMPKRVVKTQVTYWNVMVACSHGGEVECAHYMLAKMFKTLAIDPPIQHVGTYIDALARNGRVLDAAVEVKTLLYAPNQEIIVSVLDRCKPGSMDDREVAKAFVRLLEIRGISYKIVELLYEQLAEAGVVWGSNVQILKQRTTAGSAIQVKEYQ